MRKHLVNLTLGAVASCILGFGVHFLVQLHSNEPEVWKVMSQEERDRSESGMWSLILNTHENGVSMFADHEDEVFVVTEAWDSEGHIWVISPRSGMDDPRIVRHFNPIWVHYNVKEIMGDEC